LGRADPMLKSVETNPQGGLPMVIPSEVFLVLPALQRRADKKEATANELFALSMVRDVMATFAGGGDKKPSDNETTGAPVLAREVSIPTGVSEHEILQVFNELLAAMPELRDKNALAKAGFSAKAQAAIASKLQDKDRSETAKDLAQKLDGQAWHDLKGALKEITEKRIPPHVDQIFKSPDQTNPWCRAMMAILGSPHVFFNRMGLMGLSWAGLSEVGQMWQIAQDTRRALASKKPATNQQEEAILAAMTGLETDRIVEARMTRGSFFDVGCVVEVMKAEYIGQRTGHDVQDVTELIKAKYHRNGVLRLKNVDLMDDLRSVFATRELLNKALRGCQGTQVTLRIVYRTLAELEADILAPQVDILLNQLHKLGFTKQLRSHEDGMYTWLKLCEWLQVEFTQIFGQSLEHTPWYRFPFLPFLEVYWKAIKTETQIVMDKYGAKETLMSNAFIQIALFPFIMTVIFGGQMMLAALPLANEGAKSTLGISGFGGYEAENMLEEVVLYLPTPAQEPPWHKVDPRLKGRRIAKGLYLLEMPTFKPLTEILVSLAQKLEHARVLQISNMREVQVRVELPGGAIQPSHLSSYPGVKVLFDYKYPTDGSENEPATSVALAVMAPFLLAAIRSCAADGVRIVQVFDCWAG